MAAAENKIGEMTDVGGTRRHSLTEVNKFPIEWVGGFCGGGFDKAPCSATIDDRIVALNFLHTTARHFWEVGGVSFFDLGLCWCSFISFGIIIRCMAEANIQVRKHVSKVCFAAWRVFATPKKCQRIFIPARCLAMFTTSIVGSSNSDLTEHCPHVCLAQKVILFPNVSLST